MSVPKVFPNLCQATVLSGGQRRLFIGAYGFEQRTLGWCRSQSQEKKPLSEAIIFRYLNPKGQNKITALQDALVRLGVNKPKEIPFDYDFPQAIEQCLEKSFSHIKADEIVFDTSAVAKVLILATLCKLEHFQGAIRIIYSEAQDYCPKKEKYDAVKRQMAVTAKIPSRGCEDIIRLRCLSSIRMQGQPVALVVFTSFNEKLLSHVLGHMTPHRLLLINGRPPRHDYDWREEATQYIHKKYWLEYAQDNPLDNNDRLERSASTLNYLETVKVIDDIYSNYGLLERIVCAATGSKMQTVGLFFSKILHPDIQIEYPTPDSYFVKGMSTGINKVHELFFPNYAEFINNLKRLKI